MNNDNKEKDQNLFAISPNVATVPLLSNVAQPIFIVYFKEKLLKQILEVFGGNKKIHPLLIASIFISIGSMPLFFLSKDASTSWIIFPATAIQTLGFSTFKNSAEDLTTKRMEHPTTGPIVVAIYTLMQKTVNGVIIWFYINMFSKNKTVSKIFMTFLPIGCAILSYKLAWLTYRSMSKKKKSLSETLKAFFTCNTSKR